MATTAPASDYAAMAALPAPVALSGTVIHGFKRGSKELGCPTANLDVEALGAAVEPLATGIYFGWARLTPSTAPAGEGGGSGDVAAAADNVYKMVMSVGWNPYYKNEKKTVEVHLLHEFASDFYGSYLTVAVTGYLRPELNFPSLDALITAIRTDIALAAAQLDTPAHAGRKSLVDAAVIGGDGGA